MTIETKLICDGCNKEFKYLNNPVTEDKFRPGYITTKRTLHDVDCGNEHNFTRTYTMHFCNWECVSLWIKDEAEG